MSGLDPEAPRWRSATLIIETADHIWVNGEFGDIGVLTEVLPSVELGGGDEAFCELWLGPMAAISEGCPERSKRLLVRFVMGELVKRAVEEFCDTGEDWLTDADPDATHRLVKRLERWLTWRCHHEP